MVTMNIITDHMFLYNHKMASNVHCVCLLHGTLTCSICLTLSLDVKVIYKKACVSTNFTPVFLRLITLTCTCLLTTKSVVSVLQFRSATTLMVASLKWITRKKGRRSVYMLKICKSLCFFEILICTTPQRVWFCVPTRLFCVRVKILVTLHPQIPLITLQGSQKNTAQPSLVNPEWPVI